MKPRTRPASDVKDHWRDVVADAKTNGEVFITHYNRPEVVVVSMDRYSKLKADAPPLTPANTKMMASTLGGNTIPRLLREAAEAGLKVVVWFVGLSTPEQHLARVRARVASGGHDIPEEMIRQRWDSSRRNVIELMPFLADLWVFDNSQEGDAAGETIPPPTELLYWRSGAIVSPDAEALTMTPEWAKPIIVRALQLQRAAK